MKNIKMEVTGDILKIEVDLSKRFESLSIGKTIIIATSDGAQSVPNFDDIKIGLNVYTKKKEE